MNDEKFIKMEDIDDNSQDVLSKVISEFEGRNKLYERVISPKKELLSKINNNNNFYRFSPSPMNINKRESNEYKTESNEIKNDSFLNSPVSSKSKKEIDSALLAKATAKLKNIIEKKRRRSFEKKKIIIATCKLQDILEKTSKRNMTISKSKRKKKSSFNHSVSMSHRKNKKEVKRESQLSTIFKEKDKIDKILKLESILTSHHTDSNSTVTYSESKLSCPPLPDRYPNSHRWWFWPCHLFGLR